MADIDIHTGKPEAETGQAISLTATAADEIRRLMALEKSGNLYLRVGVRGGGCSGLSYIMAFDSEVGPSDRVISAGGLQVVVDEKSLKYIAGTTIDYTREMLTGGFVFKNPNQTRGCGCGNSFSV